MINIFAVKKVRIKMSVSSLFKCVCFPQRWEKRDMEKLERDFGFI